MQPESFNSIKFNRKIAASDDDDDDDEGRRNISLDVITTHTVFAVEVKSSSDQLSEWQIAWFNLLNHAGVHIEKFQVLNS